MGDQHRLAQPGGEPPTAKQADNRSSERLLPWLGYRPRMHPKGDCEEHRSTGNDARGYRATSAERAYDIRKLWSP
jgi:hypothetical protein